MTYQWVSQADPLCEWIRKDSTTDLIDLRRFFEDDREREVPRGKWDAVEKRRRRVGTYDGFSGEERLRRKRWKARERERCWRRSGRERRRRGSDSGTEAGVDVGAH